MNRRHVLKLHTDDNVATVLDNIEPGRYAILGGPAGATIDVAEPIVAGHKVALQAIACDAHVVKYGVAIGHATAAIAAGMWVHTHNCKSRLDERSHTLDRRTGATTDTPYV